VAGEADIFLRQVLLGRINHGLPEESE
jgi:hypothetical protein